jgi:hypothetical protein
MGGGKGKKYHSKENKHCNVISVNKKHNKRHYLLNQWIFFFVTNTCIFKILINDLVRNQHTYNLQYKRLSLHNKRLPLQNEQLMLNT